MRNYKRIPFKNLHNCRDLGGYECENGGFFEYHKLYRSDGLQHLTNDEWETIEKMDVATIIDLRSNSEQELMAYNAPNSIEVFSMPMQSDDIKIDKFNSDLAGKSFMKSLSETYELMLKNHPDRISSILNCVAQRISDGAVLYHCTAGKDRTGILTSLIYKLCGVSNYDIIADYQVTEIYNSQNSEFKKIPENFKGLLNSNSKNMINFLNVYDEINAENLMYQNGLDKQKVQNLKCSVISNK